MLLIFQSQQWIVIIEHCSYSYHYYFKYGSKFSINNRTIYHRYSLIRRFSYRLTTKSLKIVNWSSVWILLLISLIIWYQIINQPRYLPSQNLFDHMYSVIWITLLNYIYVILISSRRYLKVVCIHELKPPNFEKHLNHTNRDNQ